VIDLQSVEPQNISYNVSDSFKISDFEHFDESTTTFESVDSAQFKKSNVDYSYTEM